MAQRPLDSLLRIYNDSTSTHSMKTQWLCSPQAAMSTQHCRAPAPHSNVSHQSDFLTGF